MGCGQSKIHLYPRKSKSKTNGKKSGNVDADAEEDDEGHKDAVEKEMNGHGKSQQYHLRNEEDENNGLLTETDGKGGQDESGLNGEITIPMLRGKNLSLLSSHDILSSSQHNFFKLLDQKIDEGADYDSTSETEIALEEARLNALVQHWESASLTASLCSSTSRSLQSTPIRQNSAPPIRMMSPKRDPRVLPQAALAQQQQQGYTTMPMASLQQQQQQQQVVPQYQYQSQTMSGPPTYLTQPYPANPAAAGMMRVGPRMLPVGVGMTAPVGGVVPSNGMISSAMPQSSTIRIPVGYYSQHPSMMPIPHQMVYSSAAAGVSIPQSNPTQAAYYAELKQHPLQVPQQQQPPQMNPMMGYNPLMGVVMDGGVTMMTENKVFPAAISVQRLAPQVQRQLRETQELIKDSCQGLVYGSPGPPTQQQQPQKMLVQPGPSTSTGPPPPPRTSTLRKNVNVNAGSSSGNSATANNTSFETQDYS